MGRPRITDVFRITRFRPDARSEIDEELAFHFEEVIRGLVAEGMTRDEAGREARRRFGSVDAYRRQLEATDRDDPADRVRRSGARVASVATMLGHALRAVSRTPALALTVVVTLGLGIGANVAIFRMVDRLLLKPPDHVQEPDRVRLLYAALDTPEGRQTRMSGSYPDFHDLQAMEGFEAVAAYTARRMIVGEGTEVESRTVKVASGDLFSVLRVDAVYGRAISAADDRLAAEPVAMLSWELWDREYGRDPDALGRTIRVGNGRYTVIGVAPRGFTGAGLSPGDLWLPLVHFAANEEEFPWQESRYFAWLKLVARLTPGVEEEAALAEATAVFRAAGGDEPASRAAAFIDAASLILADRPDAGGEADVARWLLAVSLIVLLLACANVANVLLTRNLRRRRELAVRAALGMGRRRLVGQLMAETAILAVLGGVAGLVLAGLVGGGLYGVLVPDIALSSTVFDVRILIYSAAAVMVTALLAGVLPALLASGPDLVTSLSAGGERAGARRTRTQAGLLVLQVTLSVVLLTGAAVYTRSLVNLRGIDLGFDTDGLALVQLELDGTRSGWGLLSEPEDGPAWPPNEFARVSDLVQERLSELPTVEGAALVHPTPFMFELAMPIEVPGLDSVPRTGAGGPIPIGVSAEYFRVMDLDLVAGRGFDADDDRFGAQPVAVLNETMAGMLWPGEDPLGRCIMPGGADHPCASVVGVVEDAHRQAVIEDDPGMVYYVPVRQQILGGAPEGIFVRTAGADPAAVRAAVLAASPRIRFAHVQSFDEITGYELRPWRLGATMLSGFGILALLVAGVGLYSVFAFDVAGRSRELGLRSALGATRHALLRLVLREVVVLGGTGLALGVGAIVVLRRWIDPVLYETSALDLATLGPVLALLLGVAVVAAALPGRRAATVDPIEALRTE